MADYVGYRPVGVDDMGRLPGRVMQALATSTEVRASIADVALPRFVPAQDFNSVEGNNELNVQSGGLRPMMAWSFDKDTVLPESIVRTMCFPHGTGPLSVDLVWYSGYSPGAVAWTFTAYEYSADQVIYPSVPTPDPAYNFTSGTPDYTTPYQIKEHRMGATGFFVPDVTRFQTIVISRNGGDAADTLGGDARLLGVRFTPVQTV